MLEKVFTSIPTKLISVPSKIQYMDKVLKSLQQAENNSLTVDELNQKMNAEPNKKIFNEFEINENNGGKIPEDHLLTDVFLKSTLYYFVKIEYVKFADDIVTLTAEGELKIFYGGFAQEYEETHFKRKAQYILWILAVLGFGLSIINTWRLYK